MRRSDGPDLTGALLNEIIDDAKRAAAEAIEFTYARAADMCESPIEKLFLAQIIHPQVADEFSTRVWIERTKDGVIGQVSPPPFQGIYVYPQITIGQYRVDFLLIEQAGRDQAKLIVELDGHDFHEKTKEQAQRDKARDRFLVGQGYRLLRFTGSEVFKNPYASVHEAICILMGIA